MLVIFLLVQVRSFSGVRFWCWVVCICSDSCCTDERRFWWWVSLLTRKYITVVTTWRVSADLMDQSLQEVIADRIWKGLERKKAYGFLHKPSRIWWPLADLNCGPIDYERRSDAISPRNQHRNPAPNHSEIHQQNHITRLLAWFYWRRRRELLAVISTTTPTRK